MKNFFFAACLSQANGGPSFAKFYTLLLGTRLISLSIKFVALAESKKFGKIYFRACEKSQEMVKKCHFFMIFLWVLGIL